jgi:DNA/RNA non-specific endonuclease
MKTRCLFVLSALLLLIEAHAFAFYDPGTGRWLSKDPIEEDGGLNLYGFVRNNAVSMVDSFGLSGAFVAPSPVTAPSGYPYLNSPRVGPRVGLPYIPTPGPMGGYYNYNTHASWRNAEVATMANTTGKQAQDACSRLAMLKPGENQYFYKQTSIGRATGAAAVLWGRQPGQAAGVEPPGFKAARAFRAGSVHRGHLIPNKYGGSGGMENIVTQEANFNLSTIKIRFEHRIDAALNVPNMCTFVCVLNTPAYRGQRATGVMDPGKPVPIGFAVAIITGNSYFGDSIIQPVIMGDLANDIAPWNTWATGDIPLN